MQQLRTDFKTREEISAYLQEEFPFLKSVGELSPFPGGRRAGLARLAEFSVEKYGSERNFMDGEVARLSPYISRGCLQLEEVRQWALKFPRSKSVEIFVSQLAWRAFFHLVYQEMGAGILKDMEIPKVSLSQHLSSLPDDIAAGKTGLCSMDRFIGILKDTGYLHNHARMYLASYVVHFRKVHWRVGADWMYGLLIDGDFSSNHLSWQWVASTFSNKPYYFNWDNLRRYAGSFVTVDSGDSDLFDFSYEELALRLFGGEYVAQNRRSSGRYS